MNKDSEYKKYTEEEMINIINNKGIYFVYTSEKDKYIISKEDLEDFIINEVNKKGHSIDIEVYPPLEDEPILVTRGWFLDKCNKVLRGEIIEKLIKLQTFEIEAKDTKIFDNLSMEALEKCGDLTKYFKKYYEDELEV